MPDIPERKQPAPAAPDAAADRANSPTPATDTTETAGARGGSTAPGKPPRTNALRGKSPGARRPPLGR